MELLQTVGVLDIVFIAILAISILIGLIRGAVREVLSLVGLGLAIYLAFNFSEMIAKNYVSQLFEQPRVSYVVAFVLIIVVTIFAVALVNLLISQLLKASGLSLLNRFLGMVFGILRATVICSVITLMLGLIPDVQKKSWWQASTLVPIFQQITQAARQYIPEGVINSISAAGDKINQTASQAVQSAVKSGADGGQQRVVPQGVSQSETTQKVLQSIDASRKESGQTIIELESVSNPDNTQETDKKPTLESYQ